MASCPDCGRKNPDKAKICDNCGAFLKPGKIPVSSGKAAATAAVIRQPAAGPQKVIITDIQIPFWSMVMFTVRCVIASVPALTIVALLILLLISVAGGLWNFIIMFFGKFIVL